MTIAYLCVLIAALLPYCFVGYAKFSTKGYNNNKPRDFLDKLEGKTKRAHYAHLNSFEAFPSFAASIIISQLAGVNQGTISSIAVLFIIFRIFYGFCYIFDQANARSLMWFGGIICVISLFILALK